MRQVQWYTAYGFVPEDNQPLEHQIASPFGHVLFYRPRATFAASFSSARTDYIVVGNLLHTLQYTRSHRLLLTPKFLKVSRPAIFKKISNLYFPEAKTYIIVRNWLINRWICSFCIWTVLCNWVMIKVFVGTKGSISPANFKIVNLGSETSTVNSLFRTRLTWSFNVLSNGTF